MIWEFGDVLLLSSYNQFAFDSVSLFPSLHCFVKVNVQHFSVVECIGNQTKPPFSLSSFSTPFVSVEYSYLSSFSFLFFFIFCILLRPAFSRVFLFEINVLFFPSWSRFLSFLLSWFSLCLKKLVSFVWKGFIDWSDRTSCGLRKRWLFFWSTATALWHRNVQQKCMRKHVRFWSNRIYDNWYSKAILFSTTLLVPLLLSLFLLFFSILFSFSSFWLCGWFPFQT